MNNREKRFAVIFDCDGVMFDSKQANINYYNQVLIQFGLPLMSKEKEAYIHMHTADESVRYILAGTSYFEEAQEYRKTLDYTPFIKDMVIDPGLMELLKELEGEFGLAVATNRSDTISKVLETYGLEDIFDIVVSSLDVKKPKPHPESIYKILDFLKIKPYNCIYIGDSIVDYETAAAADIRFISYKNRDLIADYHVDNMKEIMGIVMKESGI